MVFSHRGKTVNYAGKREGLQFALVGVEEAYQRRFVEYVLVLCRAGRRFTSEDVTGAVGLPRAQGTNKNNAVGALMAALAARGVIRKTGRLVRAVSSQANGRELREWQGGVNSDAPYNHDLPGLN